VLDTERQATWVEENLVQEPKLLAESDGCKEFTVGDHDLLYFHLGRIEIETESIQDTAGRFNVLVLVDGEKAIVESLDDPSASYTMNYLDMVVVPANLGRYRIRNLGNHPICMHKTHLKDNYRDSL